MVNVIIVVAEDARVRSTRSIVTLMVIVCPPLFGSVVSSEALHALV